MLNEIDMSVCLIEMEKKMQDFADHMRLNPNDLLSVKLVHLLNFFHQTLEMVKEKQDAKAAAIVNKTIDDFIQELTNLKIEYHGTVIPPNTDKSKWH